MQLKKIYHPSETEKLTASTQARCFATARFLAARGTVKPAYRSRFRPSAKRLEEIAKGCAESLTNTPPDKTKKFRKW